MPLCALPDVPLAIERSSCLWRTQTFTRSPKRATSRFFAAFPSPAALTSSDTIFLRWGEFTSAAIPLASRKLWPRFRCVRLARWGECAIASAPAVLTPQQNRLRTRRWIEAGVC